MIRDRSHTLVQSDDRVRLLGILISIMFFFLALRLFQLQVLRGPELYKLAEQNRTQIIPLLAPRGLVMDRQGQVLLDNAPRFSLFYTKSSLKLDVSREFKKELLKWVPEKKNKWERRLKEANKTGKMTRVISDISREVALVFMEKRLTLPGVNVVVEPQRRARYEASASHILGYVDEINPRELDEFRMEGYRMGQLIGKNGVEKIYDSYLRGEDGGLQFEMDAGGRHVQIINHIPSKSGSDIFLTIDNHIQKIVEEGLSNSPSQRGAAVVMNPQTGSILALASYPGFDPTQKIIHYLKDTTLPLFNRALQGGYAPGSIFKIITGLAALENGWDIAKKYYCRGSFSLGSKKFACWKRHNRMDFLTGVAWSCNVYFYNIGLYVGANLIHDFGKSFGYGEKTGIDLPSESGGLLPNPLWKKESQNEIWFKGDTVNFSIGQGYVLVTPLQAASMISAVANGGRLMRPYVVSQIINPDGVVIFENKPKIKNVIEFSPSVLETIQTGMQEVVASGTGQRVKRRDLVIGAKTGTAQNPHGDDHAWFIAYAGYPEEAPSLALAVFVENGGHGSSAAGPIAKRVINKVFPKKKKGRNA